MFRQTFAAVLIVLGAMAAGLPNSAKGLCTSIRRHKMWWDFGFAS
jgi:hypothetical protein